MFLFIFLSLVLFQTCTSVIFDLDDIEYNRMPPLFALDEYGTCMIQGGTYCVARFEVYAEPSNDLIKMIAEYSEHYQKHYNHSIIDRGICLTTTCGKYFKGDDIYNSEEINNIMPSCINDSLWREYGLQIKSSNLLSCEKSTTVTETDTYDWMVMLIFVAILLLNTVGTCYDILLRMNKKHKNSIIGYKFVLNFSTIKNFESLMNPNCDTKGLEYLKAFNGVKVITSVAVVLAHTLMMFSSGFTDNPHDFENAYDKTHYHIIFSGLAVINIFFLLSGFLLAFKLQKKEYSQSLTWYQVPQLILRRWVRLSAPYAIVLLFSATWLRHLGSGPLWNLHVTRGVAADCRKYWWQHLLYLHNYNSNDKLCVIPSWQLAADTQLFVIGIILYVATTSARSRGLVLFMVMVLGLVAPAIHTWLQNLDPIVLIYPEYFRTEPVHDMLRLMHNRGHNNVTCYVMGMLTCYLLYNSHKLQGTLTDNKVSRRLTRFLVWAAIPIVLGILLSGRIFYEGERPSIIVRVAYAVGHRFFLGAFVAIAIISVASFAIVSEKKQSSEHKKSENYYGIFAWRGWVVPEQLSYCVSLLHMNIVHVIIGSRTQLDHFSSLNLAINFIGVLLMSYLLAVPLFLLVEAPTKKLLEYYTSNQEHRNSKIN